MASPSYVSHVVDTVNAIDPDVVFLVGDLIESDPKELVHFTPLGEMKSKLGKFAVLGNHDYAFPSGREDHFEVANQVETVLEAADFTVLRNEATQITFEDKQLAIGGIDDRWIGKADPQLVSSLVASAGADLNLILHHEPDAVLDFQLCQIHILLLDIVMEAKLL